MNAQEPMMQVGTVLEGRYRVVSEGSRRDPGALYRAYDMRDDRLVEILVLSRQATKDPAAALLRWEQVNRAVMALQQPALIPFERLGQAGEWLYGVRSPTEGRPLADLLAQVGSLKIEAAVEITIRLC